MAKSRYTPRLAEHYNAKKHREKLVKRLFCVENAKIMGECEKAQSAIECLNIRVALLGNHQMTYGKKGNILFILLTF